MAAFYFGEFGVTEKKVGERFPMQFVWQLPERGDYLRAVFEAVVQEIRPAEERYLIQLAELKAWRQESNRGEMRPQEEMATEYWQMVYNLVGKKALVAWEGADGRSLHMRLATLTGEHNFFHRFN